MNQCCLVQCSYVKLSLNLNCAVLEYTRWRILIMHRASYWGPFFIFVLKNNQNGMILCV